MQKYAPNMMGGMTQSISKPSPSLNKGPSTKPVNQFTEVKKLRVPKNLVKRYNVMRIKAPRPIKFGEIKEANMVRKSKKQVFAEEDVAAMPTHGAGSVYNYERKEEARKKRRGYAERKINTDDLPYALRLGGKGGKRYTGKKEPNLVNASYFVLTQCPDGVFEAVPVQAWYNFLPDIDYATMSSEEVEHEFSKRSRALQDFNEKYNFGMNNMMMEEAQGSYSFNKIKVEDRGLKIHDDEIDMDGDEEDLDAGSDEEKAGSSKKKDSSKKEKDIFRGKKGKNADGVDSDEEETFENMESKEVDYMSESSSEDELLEMDDEPDPEKDNAGKAKDDLNLFLDSDDEEEKELDEAGKELKAILKKEAGGDTSSGEDDEEDEEEVDEDNIDNEFSSSAVFMQGKDSKKKKGRSGSTPNSKTGSRSNTPINVEQTATETLSQAALMLKDGKAAGAKRTHENATPSPESKKQKLSASPKTVVENIRTSSPSVRPGTPSDSGNGITEEAIRRYLTHKPMTTTDLMRKFKNKAKLKNMSKEQTVNAIATILKKIQPHQEKIDGKLYLSIKSKK